MCVCVCVCEILSRSCVRAYVCVLEIIAFEVSDFIINTFGNHCNRVQ